ncbi:MAG: aminotransferase class I/II-fold pyridoxal phosphate-dependent enzyme [Pirellulales bacterium]
MNNKPPRIYMSPPHMGGAERDLLMAAFDSNWIAPLGPHVDAFEREFAEVVEMPHAVALSSGTASLHLALILLGIGRGDEVLTSSFTFAATANAIRYVGAEPVFLDSDQRTWNLDPQLLADELRECDRRGRRPKCLVSVDVNGQCCDYQPIQDICRQYDIPIIEDAAEALGAKYRDQPAGQFGDISCFSFNGNKIITTSGGGMLVTRRHDWADKARFLATQARDPAPHYQHSQIGYNYRLSNLLAAVGRGQLQVLGDRVRKRRANFEYYLRRLSDLPGITFMPEFDGSFASRWLTAILVDPDQFGCDREQIRLALEAENIESRPLWKPMHLQPVFAECRARGGRVSQQFFEQGLCLPSGSSLTDADLERIVSVIQRCAASAPTT